MTAADIITNPQDMAEEANLHYSNTESIGFGRVAKGKKFIYLDKDNKRITDKATIERIENLRIPPAWTKVWISPQKNGHIQAMGLDAQKRKQYIYHEKWITLSQENKFNKMLFFADILPDIRGNIYTDMQIPQLSLKKVVATVVWLLEHTYIRIGNEAYAKENQHFGLTTLRNKHVDVTGEKVSFHFIGKSGKEHEVNIEHPKVAKTIRKLEELPGYELFQYVDPEKNRHVVTSQDVNDYLKEITGDEHISAKDFRTWGGTILSAATLADMGDVKAKTQIQKNITQAVKTVAKHLGNTPAVCRSYYIHPVIPKAYEEHILVPFLQNIDKYMSKKPARLQKEEYAVKLLLKDYQK